MHARRAASLEGLDDDHAPAAARARMRECRRRVAISGIGVVALRLRDGEQLTCSRDVLGTFAAGEQTVVTDAVEAGRQHVDEEASDELVCGEWHRLVSIATFDAIVLPPEG